MARTGTWEVEAGETAVETRPATAVALLQQVALAANSGLSPTVLLERIAALTVEALGADGAAVLLADEAGGLSPACLSGRAVEALPRSLVDVAGLAGSTVVAPLVGDGRPVGLFVVAGACAGTAELVAAVAALASIAVRNARLVERAEAKAGTLARLVAVAAELNRTSSLSDVVAGVQAAYADVLGAGRCEVHVRPPSSPPPSAPDRVPGRARRMVPSVSHPVADGDHRTVELEPTQHSGSTVHFPLRTADGYLGEVEAHVARALDADDLETGQALADQAAAAIARARMGDRLRLQLLEAEALARLSEVVAGSGGLTVAVRELNRALPADLGIRLRSISVAQAALRVAVGGRVPDATELEAIRSWRAVLGKGGRPALRPCPGGVLVPVTHRSKVHGALRVGLAAGPVGDSVVSELLLAIGAGCAELVHKAGLQRSLAESERRLAVAAERDRIAQDLHDSVGQLITAMGMRLAQYVADAPDKVWRARLEELLQMAGQGNREVRQSVYALLFLQARGAALPSSIRDLCGKFETTTGMPVRFLLRGTATPLASVKEDALFRTAHEALVNVERHARASMVTVALEYGDGEVSLSVRDDGVGLGHRDPFGRSGHFGIRAMQRRLEDAGGELRIRNAGPRGVVVEARIAKAARKKGAARAAGTGRRR